MQQAFPPHSLQKSKPHAPQPNPTAAPGGLEP